MEQKLSNYEKWCEEWGRRFLTLDQTQLQKTLPELKEEGDYLTLFHFGKKYGIHRKTGEIILMTPKDHTDTLKPHAKNAMIADHPVAHAISTNIRFNIYTLLWYAKPTARLQNHWVTFGDLKDARPFAPAFQKGVLLTFAKTFTGHLDKLIFACEALGGQKLPHSDAGYQINAFECIPVRFLFWEGDDEFPAQANMLFDVSATDFIHVESVVTIATVGLNTLAEAAGVTVSVGGFQTS
ncbi:DUF3786 domain-containing protein [Marvinbryantia sp.]|uniref:DUF3786 domain-containing protein n=1 Tax=Marvinbryantia sp. TaxID=2496532 RepID=UPI0025E459D6|nr:DUF3786 domain-containing protein [uncultured Marvinbryantia sp.]